MAFKIKQGDTRPAYVADLKDDFGLVTEAAINLTTATTVALVMRLTGSNGSPKVHSPAVVVNAAQGRVQYTWTTGDTNVVGVYDAEWQITWADGGIETVPNAGYMTIEIVDDLD